MDSAEDYFENKYLSIATILRYLDASPSSPSFQQRETLINKNSVVFAGITNKKGRSFPKFIKVLGVCLSSTNPDVLEYDIQGTLLFENAGIDKFICSCKNGKSGKCKHITAVLLFISRLKFGDLEIFSSYQLKNYMKSRKNKKDKETGYVVRPLLEELEACGCMNKKLKKKVKVRELTPSEKQNCLDRLVEAAPNSALALHVLKGRRQLSDGEMSGSGNGINK